MEDEPLSELERELLELCSMSAETTTTLHEEMLERPLERPSSRRPCKASFGAD